MLIYNSTKEFIGIDEHDLKALGFSNLSQLRSEVSDFADLFVRAPGYVHNFKHVHWIDFVSYAESAEESKVIISVKSKSYTASLGITKVYLTDNPSSEAYFVALNGLRPLSSKENKTVASEVREKPASVLAIDEEQYKEMIPDEPIIEGAFDIPEEVTENTEPIAFIEEPYEIPDTPLDIDFDEEPEPIIQKRVTPAVTSEVEDDDGEYVFDPKVASDELGLPVDLIEEFIQDFTGQATEFKAEMYSALDANDLERVSMVSHKLKGVAANLRVENALDAITTVNISKDPDIIKTNLDLFYRIMNKLVGGDASVAEEPVSVSATVPAVEDDVVLDFKEETPIEDVAISDKIEFVEVSYSKELSANAIGLDMETFEELFVDYIQDCRNISSHIHQALAQDNLEKCAKEARILKGMSDSIQMEEFSSELDSLVSASDKNEMTKAIERIDEVIEQISK